MIIKSKGFTYNTNVVSDKQFNEHLKLYEGYIKKSNEISEILNTNAETQTANATYSKYRGLKESQGFALNGVILHELYFQNMGTMGSSIPKNLSEIFTKNYKGVENFTNDFIACAKSSRGWCVFGYEQRSQSFLNVCMDSHSIGYVCLLYPIIVLDMYEHAYFLDYGTNKTEYINNFVSSIKWDIIDKRLQNLF